MEHSAFNTGYVKTITVALFISVILFGCRDKKTDYVDTQYNKELVPSMETDSVTELISDSGLIRYKMIAKKWLVFDASSDPHWFFPKGIYLEQFDTTFQIKATLKADTAWNYTNRKLWKLKGHVFMRNIKNETFSSEELFWNEKTGKVYSDKYIEINKPDELLLKGKGFESDQYMTEYTVHHPGGTDIFFEEKDQENATDPTSTNPVTSKPINPTQPVVEKKR